LSRCEKPVAELVDLCGEPFGPTVIDDDEIGTAALIFERPLGLLSGRQGSLVPAALRVEAGKSLVARSVDPHNVIAKGVPAGLKEDCGIENDRAGHAPAHDPGDRALESSAHPRVQDRFKVAERSRVGKDDRAQGTAVDPGRARFGVWRAKDPRAESCDHLVANGRLIQKCVTDRIGIEHECAALGEQLGQPALAPADRADHSDDRNRAVFPRAGRPGLSRSGCRTTAPLHDAP
jgi:hypothetical protein